MERDLQQRVLAVICDVFNLKGDEILPEDSLRNDLGLDSLKQMTLFIALEDEFQQTIAPEQVANLDTVNEIVDFIQKKLQELSAP